MQLAQRLAQIFKLGRIHREQAAEHHLLRRLEAGQGRGRAAAFIGDGVADLGVGHLLDLGGDEADFARPQFFHGDALGREDADLFHLIDGIGGHHADFLALLQFAINDAHQNDDTQISIVKGIDQQRLQRRIQRALGRRQAGDDGFQHQINIQSGLGADRHRIAGVNSDHILDLLLDPIRFGGGQVDLVEDGHDIQPGINRLIDIGEGLRLDALAGIHHQQRAFAGGQAARHFIAKVHMARRVHQVEDIILAVLGLVIQPHGLGLDGDAAFPLDIHRIENLVLHVARRDGTGELDQPVGQGGFAMVNMGDDGKIADLG